MTRFQHGSNARSTDVVTSDRPIPRTVAFDFKRPTPLDWFAGSVAASCMLSGYTILFPALESIMVRQVAAVASEVAQVVDRDRIRGFILQESAHARDHRRSLAALRTQGFQIDRIERSIDRLCQQVLLPLNRLGARTFGTRFPVGIFAGAEHWTAGLSSLALREGGLPVRLGEQDKDDAEQEGPAELELLFLWHCCEELEHKAVVADVFAALGGGEFSRVTSYVLASIVLEAVTLMVTGALVAQLPRVFGPEDWANRGGWRGLGREVRRELGTLPRLHWSIFRQYLRPGFHPNDEDTSAITADGFRRLGEHRTWVARADAEWRGAT